MFDIVTIGGAVQDLFFLSPDYEVRGDDLVFTWGEKFVVDNLFVDVGGGACNSAVGFSRLGLKTALWSQIADDPAGDLVLRRLKSEKISLDFVKVVEGGATSLSCIFVDETGERSIVMFRGGNDELDLGQVNREKLLSTRWLFVAELTGNPTPLITQIAKDAVDKNVKLVLVPGLEQLEQGPEKLKEILQRTEVLIFNDFEVGKFLGRGERQKYSPEEIKEMLGEIYDFGVGLVVITKDVEGAQAYDGDIFYSHPAPEVENPTDTTGAGDAFAAGFVAELVEGRGVDRALELGTKNAGAVIQEFGAQTGLVKL